MHSSFREIWKKRNKKTWKKKFFLNSQKDLLLLGLIGRVKRRKGNRGCGLSLWIFTSTIKRRVANKKEATGQTFVTGRNRRKYKDCSKISWVKYSKFRILGCNSKFQHLLPLWLWEKFNISGNCGSFTCKVGNFLELYLDFYVKFL